MKQYLKLLKTVLKKGELIENRTNINTISYFGTQTRYDISKSFPLLTTKKVYFKAIVHELLWFIKGDTNIKYLVDNNVRIWNEWPYEKFKNSKEYKNETIEEFAKKIKTNDDFAKKWGNLGPVYGKQWRNFDEVDQLINAINDLKNNPRSRRIIVSSWNPKEINNMALPPCHCFYQFYVNGNKLSCQLYQRSADLFLGVPFNIASYALLTYMVAQVTNLEPHEFIHTIGDAHIYENHIDQVKIQLKRRPKKLPTLKLNPNIKNILDFKFDDIQLIDYQPHEKIEAKVAV
ncbi:thymidylate synthase [Malacoplasma iowae]|uniref:thymidylate synthase n=1 Tax=Malacoplasma iowae TaxID=2116 RepID=UPI00387399AA|nr:thymidylate synthase [Malacoplasma iowae]